MLSIEFVLSLHEVVLHLFSYTVYISELTFLFCVQYIMLQNFVGQRMCGVILTS